MPAWRLQAESSPQSFWPLHLLPQLTRPRVVGTGVELPAGVRTAEGVRSSKGLCLAVCPQVVGHHSSNEVQTSREGLVPMVKVKGTLVASAAAWGWDCVLILTAV